MEKQFKSIDNNFEKLVKDAGIHNPSANFLNDVMSAVNRTAIKEAYKPLISRSGWFVIGTLFAVSFLMLYFYSSPEVSILQNLNLFEKVSFKLPTRELQAPKTLVYAVGCLGLFLFQIPFLKKYLKSND